MVKLVFRAKVKYIEDYPKPGIWMGDQVDPAWEKTMDLLIKLETIGEKVKLFPTLDKILPKGTLVEAAVKGHLAMRFINSEITEMDIIEIVFVPMGRSREMVGFAISGDTNPKIPLKGEGIFIKFIEMGPWFEKEWAWFA